MTISDDDRGFRLGDALFETVRVTANGPLALSRHRERFDRSARALGFPAKSLAAGEVALKSLEHAEAGIWRVTISRDDAEAPFGGSGCVVVQRRDVPAPTRPRLQTLPGWHFPGYFLAEHKTTSFVRYSEARRRAIEAGFDDALLVSSCGVVGEASAANVFVVLENARIVTPAIDGILPGTARARVLDGQRELGFDLEVRPVQLEELHQAREIVLTNAAIGAVAAASLDGAPLGEQLAPRLRALLERR